VQFFMSELPFDFAQGKKLRPPKRPILVAMESGVPRIAEKSES